MRRINLEASLGALQSRAPMFDVMTGLVLEATVLPQIH